MVELKKASYLLPPSNLAYPFVIPV